MHNYLPEQALHVVFPGHCIYAEIRLVHSTKTECVVLPLTTAIL